MSFKPALTATEHAVALHNFKRAVRLLIRGAAHELTEHHSVIQPEADIAVFSALFVELDEHIDFSALQISEVLNTIRASAENEHANAHAAMEDKCPPKPFEFSHKPRRLDVSEIIAEYDAIDEALGGDCVAPRDFAHQYIREAVERMKNDTLEGLPQTEQELNEALGSPYEVTKRD